MLGKEGCLGEVTLTLRHSPASILGSLRECYKFLWGPEGVCQEPCARVNHGGLLAALGKSLSLGTQVSPARPPGLFTLGWPVYIALFLQPAVLSARGVVFMELDIFLMQ